ncbi:Methionyl-tRNA formyltransferase [Lambiella insularis]|nr:Methionyl-tRNA formyltransferase [Lambiella insularis]
MQPPLPNDEPINLVIAVSFGLLIPSRILKASKYGGLNVHPSMLPDFRGAAPIHWALLHGCKTTGISLQTLHPHHFDQGRVLAQTPLPGLDIPCSETITPPELSAFLAPRAAELLVSSLRDRVFSSDAQSQVHTTLLRPAPKIVPEHRHIDWSLWSADEILRRHRVIGPLWNNGASGSSPGLHMRRIIWSSGFQLMPPSFDNAEPGMGRVSGSDPHLYIQTADKQTLRAESAIVEGEVAKSASSAANKANMVDSRSSFMIGSSKYMKLWSPFS